MEEMLKSKVYVMVDEGGRVTRCEGGLTTPADLTGWIQIDEGTGDRYNLCQSNYFDGGLCTTDGIPRYKLADGAPLERTQEEIDADRLPGTKAAKEKELSNACNAAIVAGMDVETSQGMEHFSLQETDQINLTTALSAVEAGAAGYPYHADGQLCRMFVGDEIRAIAQASIQHKLYHTTLCNHLLTWARRAETAAELEGITYSADALPEDLAANMTQVLADSATMTT